MSAKTNPLAAMDRLIGNTRTMAGLTGDPQMREHLREGEEARAAVAELVEACREFHEANENIGDRKYGSAHERLKRYGKAERRIRAALARFEVQS